jgi:hypothetical protein
MLELYRGLIDIIISRCEGLNESLSAHIRRFSKGENDPNNFEVAGFWNLLLEITFLMFVKLFSALGIIMTLSLAVIFFPLQALRVVSMNILNHRAEPFPPQMLEPQEKK